jgi:hypothetical protein
MRDRHRLLRHHSPRRIPDLLPLADHRGGEWLAGGRTRPGPTGVAGPGLVPLRSPHAPAGRWAFQDGYAWRRHGYVCGNATVTRMPSRNQ